jgi:predicted transcriptional regulator
VIKSEARTQQAENRRKDIEMQLAGSKYGIAYTDGTERITQLNRPVENNLMNQIKYLTETLMGQLGITNEILNGTANEETMRNYYNRIVAVILTAFAEEMRRKFLTKTARTQGQSISFFPDYFKLIPISALANIAGTLTQNAIVSSNEIRTFMGLKPSDDPEADKLKNKNINPVDESQPASSGEAEVTVPEEMEETIQNGTEV